MQDELKGQMAKDLGIGELPPDEQQTLITQFGEVALKAAAIAVAAKLPQDKRDEFAKLAEAGDPAALKQFLDREVPDHDSVAKAAVAEEIRRFREVQAA